MFHSHPSFNFLIWEKQLMWVKQFHKPFPFPVSHGWDQCHAMGLAKETLGLAQEVLQEVLQVPGESHPGSTWR